MADFCRTARRADATHNAVERFVRAVLKFAALRIGDVLHDVQVLRTRASTRIAADACVDFGIELHHDPLFGRDRIDVVHLLYERKKRQRRDVHIVDDFCLARQARVQAVLSFDAVHRRACAAKTVSAPAAAHEFVPRVFHRIHDRQMFGHFISFPEQVNVYQFFRHGTILFTLLGSISSLIKLEKYSFVS